MKKCRKCNLLKSLDNYKKWANKKDKDRLFLDCNECLNDTETNWHRSAKLKGRYGISLIQYNQLLKSQNSVCAICHQEDNYRNLAVDHCHETKEVRGLLCTRCNEGLGSFKDDPEILKNAIDYLRSVF